MKRRNVLKGGLAAGIGGVIGSGEAGAQTGGNHFFELRTYELRNDFKPARIQEFFQTHFLGAMKRAGVGPVGCFSVVSGFRSPALVVLLDYPSLQAMQTAMERTLGDKTYAEGWRAFETGTGGELPYVRYDSVLLRAFDSHPKVEVPPSDAKRAPRVFEIRTYESRSAFSLREKVTMFNQEEIKIFRNCGFAPVFFGESVIATRMPHLTYMVGFDDMASRDKAWDKFRADPDWVRIRTKPGWTDPEAVSNSHTAFLRPTSYSEIR
jgi:hypothetical protein